MLVPDRKHPQFQLINSVRGKISAGALAHARTHTHTQDDGFELQSACFSPVQTQIRLDSLGRVSGTHQAVCTAISSLLLSMFCPLSFRRDYATLSSCGEHQPRRCVGKGNTNGGMLFCSPHRTRCYHHMPQWTPRSEALLPANYYFAAALLST